MLCHLAKNAPRYVIHLINGAQEMTGLRFVCFAKNHVPNIVGSDISFIAINTETDEMYLYRIYLWGPFKRWSFLCMHCWDHSVTKLSRSFKAIYKERDSI